MSAEFAPSQPEDRSPTPLPPLLAEFLRTQELIGITHTTDQGTALVIKAPASEIERLRGPLYIQHRHELYRCPTAPVIRLLTRLYDQPTDPLALESFINVQDPAQRAEYEQLTHQEEFRLHFYDEQLQHRLTKQFQGLQPRTMAEVLRNADQLRASIPPTQFDFEYAKALVLGVTHL